MKKAKVIKITKMEKKDSYGNTSFILEFENGDKGFYTSKDEDQKKFTVGQESEYVIEEKTGATGKTYYKITIPNTEKKFGAGGKQQVDPRVQMISFAMAYTKDLAVAGKIQVTDIERQFNSLYAIMTSKI